MLAYTQARLLIQTADIVRNTAGFDAFGAEEAANWQPHLTVPCRAWWTRSSGARSANRVYVDPAREAPVQEGGLMVALGTDVTESDRIMGIANANGTPFLDGLFQITAVLVFDDHMELNMLRVQSGA